MNNSKEQIETIIQKLKELTSVYHNAASKTGISENEIWIWYALVVSKKEYTQQDICAEWFFPKQTVNNIINNFVKKGFATLETVSEKRNQKIIHLTEEGKKFGLELIAPIYDAEKKSINLMQNEELATCANSLNKYLMIFREEINKI